MSKSRQRLKAFITSLETNGYQFNKIFEPGAAVAYEIFYPTTGFNVEHLQTAMAAAGWIPQADNMMPDAVGGYYFHYKPEGEFEAFAWQPMQDKRRALLTS